MVKSIGAPATPLVMFIDDNAILADSVERSFAADGSVLAISRCKDVPSALIAEDAPSEPCDVVVFNPSQGYADPAQTLDAVRAAIGPVAAIAYLPESALQTARQCLQSGYEGVVSRSGDIELLIDAVLSVSIGGQYVDGCYSDAWNGTQEPVLIGTESLTRRERQVLLSVVDGKSCRAIGRELSISGKTVETHKYRAMSKMGLSAPGDLENFARRFAWAG